MQTRLGLKQCLGCVLTRRLLRTGALTASCALLPACGSATDPGTDPDPVQRSQAALTVDCSKIDQVQVAIDAKKILGIAKDVADIYSNSDDLSKPIQLASDLLDLSSPSVDEQFQALRTELECLAQALDWKMEALDYNTNQWAPVSAAWMEAQSAGFTRGSGYDVTSHDAVVASGGLVMFERLFREGATDGTWKSIISNNKPDIIDVNQVFDWRMALPEFARLVAMRLAMIAMMDPQFTTDGLWNAELDGTDAVPGYRRVLQARLPQMTAGVRCDLKDRTSSFNGHITSYTHTDIACADVNTGLSATQQYVIPNVASCARTYNDARVPYTGYDPTCFANLPGHATASSLMDPLRRQVLSQMPIFEVQSMIDTLYLYTHPAQDLTQLRQRIPVSALPDLCLDTQGAGTDWGTPAVIAACSGGASQSWVYDREAQTVVHQESGLCLDVWAADSTPGTVAQVWGCNGGDNQRWSYDPEHGVLTSALGNVLDIQWGNLSSGTPVWTWPLNGGDAQRWWADQSYAFQPQPPSSCGLLQPGEGLSPNWSAWSCDGRFALLNGTQSEGALLLEQMITFDPPPPPPAPSGTSVTLWSQDYYNFPGILVMQGDGNLVLYDSLGGAPVWSSNTWGHPGVSLSIQNDGNLVIYDFNGAVLWASNTCCH